MKGKGQDLFVVSPKLPLAYASLYPAFLEVEQSFISFFKGFPDCIDTDDHATCIKCIGSVY